MTNSLNSSSVLSNTCNPFQFGVFYRLCEIPFIQLAENIGWNWPVWYWLIPHMIGLPKELLPNTTIQLYAISYQFHLYCIYLARTGNVMKNNFQKSYYHFGISSLFLLSHQLSWFAYQQKTIWFLCLISVSNVGWCHLFIFYVIIHWFIFSSTTVSLEISLTYVNFLAS